MVVDMAVDMREVARTWEVRTWVARTWVAHTWVAHTWVARTIWAIATMVATEDLGADTVDTDWVASVSAWETIPIMADSVTDRLTVMAVHA